MRSDKDTEERQCFQGRFCAWCSVPRPVGLAPQVTCVDFAMPGQKKNSQQLEKFEFRPPIHHSDFNSWKWQEQGSFFLRGGRVIPSCPPALGATVPTPRTPNPEPHLPPRPPSQGGPEKVTEKGAKTMTPPRLYENDEIDEIDEIDEKNRRNRRN